MSAFNILLSVVLFVTPLIKQEVSVKCACYYCKLVGVKTESDFIHVYITSHNYHSLGGFCVNCRKCLL